MPGEPLRLPQKLVQKVTRMILLSLRDGSTELKRLLQNELLQLNEENLLLKIYGNGLLPDSLFRCGSRTPMPMP